VVGGERAEGLCGASVATPSICCCACELAGALGWAGPLSGE